MWQLQKEVVNVCSGVHRGINASFGFRGSQFTGVCFCNEPVECRSSRKVDRVLRAGAPFEVVAADCSVSVIGGAALEQRDAQRVEVAAFSEDRKSLSIAVLNPSDSEQSIQLKINGTKLTSSGKLWRMAPDKIDATVQVDKAPEVKVEEQSLGALPETISVRPFSVNIYSYAVQ